MKTKLRKRLGINYTSVLIQREYNRWIPKYQATVSSNSNCNLCIWTLEAG